MEGDLKSKRERRREGRKERPTRQGNRKKIGYEERREER